MPGESGNVGIAGHRDSFFRSLRYVQVGDDILLSTPQERLHYRVSSLRVVRSTEISVLTATADPTLTLVTCYPFWFIGQAPDRLVVRATRVAEPTAAALAIPSRWSTEPSPAALLERVATPPKVRGSSDAGMLVRQAIERFPLRYGAGVASRGERRSGGPLTFDACSAAAVDHDSATAGPSGRSPRTNTCPRALEPAGGRARAARQPWEYQDVTIPSGHNPGPVLTAPGADGWEATGVTVPVQEGTLVVMKGPRWSACERSTSFCLRRVLRWLPWGRDASSFPAGRPTRRTE
jgi:LPXTG-site transpeptidase (sortase) family protein